VRAQVLTKLLTPLRPESLPSPALEPEEIRLRVLACGVCRTDLHIADGELQDPKLPLVLGHEIVGVVSERGKAVTRFSVGERVGVPWLGGTCDSCEACRAGRENLCAQARFTGYHRDGGYAEEAVADARYCFRVPAGFSDTDAAPLLCAGLIGHRAWRIAGKAPCLGIYGFGAAGHLVAQLARFEGQEVFAFTRDGDLTAQALARSLGVGWVGASFEHPPRALDAAILFAPVGALVPAALAAVRPGGTVVCAGVHMSDIPSFPYSLLWGERSIRSVANLTRADGEAFFALTPRLPLRCAVTTFPLDRAQDALDSLRAGKLDGAAVLVP
jgi:propanol-preferring alcohol dehydrogenase